MDFIDKMTPLSGNGKSEINDEWNEYIEKQKQEELNAIIAEENLRPEETRKFIAQSFADGFVTTTGVAITKVLPPIPIFGSGKVNREKKKKTVLEKLTAFFIKYFNI